MNSCLFDKWSFTLSFSYRNKINIINHPTSTTKVAKKSFLRAEIKLLYDESNRMRLRLVIVKTPGEH
jgi:hypothetical protein